MFFDSIAYAQEAAPAASSMGVSFVPLILIFVVFYFLLIRPQQKRQKQHMAMIDALKAGDQVMTNGGIYGTITSVEEDQSFIIEIAHSVKIKVAKGGIAQKIEPTVQK